MGRQYRQNIGGDDSNRRFAIVGSAVIAVLIVIAAIAVTYRQRTDAIRQSEAESIAAETAAQEGSLDDASETSADFELDEEEALNEAVRSYFDARLNADTSTIFTLFGRSDTSADEEFAEKLKAQADWIQGFQDIIVYSMPGTEDGEKLCLVTYVIDFRRTDAMAPGIMYLYAVRNGDGYIFRENLLKDKVDYAEAALESETAQTLIQEVDDALKTSLDSNSTLALIYTSFQNGAIYDEADLDLDQEVDVFIDPEDSILVDEDTLLIIALEASEAAAIEASEAAQDVYATDAASPDQQGDGLSEEYSYDDSEVSVVEIISEDTE